MEYVYRSSADLVSIVHFGFIVYVVFGQLLILVGRLAGWGWVRNPWFRVSHLSCILVVAYEAFAGIECPLTTWERDLRAAAGQAGTISSRGFISDWIDTFMACDGHQETLTWCYYGFAALVLATLVLVPPRFRRTPPPAMVAPPESEPATASSDTTVKYDTGIKAQS